MVWKEFAMEASRCSGYADLGRMLLKLQNVSSFALIVLIIGIKDFVLVSPNVEIESYNT